MAGDGLEPRLGGSATRELLNRHQFSIKKSLGQNFLIDPFVIDKIIAAAEVGPDDLIVEIGPGLGALTLALAQKAAQVVAVEIDKNLIPILEETLLGYDNVKIINGDALKLDLKGILSEYHCTFVKVVANLPYYITTPIIMNLLESRFPAEVITVMVQKEVAERMAASPGSKDYGALSLAVNYYAEAYLAANVPANCFIPRPNVDSAVIRLRTRKDPLVTVADEELLFKIIKAAFSMRRKTLVNCLAANFDISKEDAVKVLEKCGLDPRVRGETLDLVRFGEIAEAFSGLELRD